MILADTSAWVEYLRKTGSTINVQLRELIGANELATTEPVVMEVLAGARDRTELLAIQRLLGRSEFVPVAGLADYEAAAGVRRECRARGHAPGLIDCLIAAVAIRSGASVLHADADFEAIAATSGLKLYS